LAKEEALLQRMDTSGSDAVISNLAQANSSQFKAIQSNSNQRFFPRPETKPNPISKVMSTHEHQKLFPPIAMFPSFDQPLTPANT